MTKIFALTMILMLGSGLIVYGCASNAERGVATVDKKDPEAPAYTYEDWQKHFKKNDKKQRTE